MWLLRLSQNRSLFTETLALRALTCYGRSQWCWGKQGQMKSPCLHMDPGQHVQLSPNFETPQSRYQTCEWRMLNLPTWGFRQHETEGNHLHCSHYKFLIHRSHKQYTTACYTMKLRLVCYTAINNWNNFARECLCSQQIYTEAYRNKVMTLPSDSGYVVEIIKDPLVVIPKPGSHRNHLERFLKMLAPRYCNNIVWWPRYTCGEHDITYRGVKSLCSAPETNVTLYVNCSQMFKNFNKINKIKYWFPSPTQTY